MKNKILAAVQDIQNDMDSYLNYTARLSKDFGLSLELVPSSAAVTNRQKPVSIIGEGIPLPHSLKQRGQVMKAQKMAAELVQATKHLHGDVSFSGSDRTITDMFADSAQTDEALLVTINQQSSDNFFNQVFGTIETEMAKKTYLPALTIPEGCEYRKPETVLVVVRDTPDLNLDQLHHLSQTMGFKIVFAYHEDEEKNSIQRIMESMHVKFGDFIGTFRSFSMENNDDLFDKIIDYERPEWIAFANYDRSMLDRMYKINTNQLILKSNLPILNF